MGASRCTTAIGGVTNSELHTAFNSFQQSFLLLVKHYSARHNIIGKMTEAILCDKDNETYTQLNLPLTLWFLFTEERLFTSAVIYFRCDVELKNQCVPF